MASTGSGRGLAGRQPSGKGRRVPEPAETVEPVEVLDDAVELAALAAEAMRPLARLGRRRITAREAAGLSSLPFPQAARREAARRSPGKTARLTASDVTGVRDSPAC